MKKTVTVLVVVLLSLARPSEANTYALIVNGVNKDPEDRAAKSYQLQHLRAYLLSEARISPARLTILDADDVNVPPTKNGIAMAMTALASAVKPEDKFVFYYMGQANAVAEALRLNLPGPDATHEDLVKWLQPIRARRQLVVLDCPCAALAAKALAGAGRIVVCATTETEVYTPLFGRRFIPALAQAENDTNADGKVSILEAFTATARQIEQWYRDNEIMPTETPSLDDNGDGVPSEQPWRYTVESVDGAVAAEFFLAEK